MNSNDVNSTPEYCLMHYDGATSEYCSTRLILLFTSVYCRESGSAWEEETLISLDSSTRPAGAATDEVAIAVEPMPT